MKETDYVSNGDGMQRQIFAFLRFKRRPQVADAVYCHAQLRQEWRVFGAARALQQAGWRKHVTGASLAGPETKRKELPGV